MKKIRLIHTNDIHSNFERFLKMATVIETLKTTDYLLLDAGDFNDFSSLLTYSSKGIAGLKLLNQLNYDAMTIGNNEGFQPLSIIENNCDSNLLPILSCNLFKIDKSPIRGLKPSIIIQKNDIRFLIIGVSPYMPSYNEYYKHYNILATNPFQIIQDEIYKYKNKYDVVILLSHLGLKYDTFIAQALPQINIIVSGHSHEVTTCLKINQTYIHQSGYKGNYVGYMDLFFKDKKLSDVKGENIAITSNIQNDDKTEKLYLKLKEEENNKLKTPLFKIDETLYASVDSENNLTNLVTDYLYENYPCDFAILNSGLFEKSIIKGNVSLFDIKSSCNSPLYISTFETKGQIIISALKQSLKKEKCYDTYRRPGFRGKYLGKLHVSYNCKILLKDNKLDFYIDNLLIESEKTYKIVTTDYFLRGMGYEVFKNNQNGKMLDQSICDALIDALQNKRKFLKINNFRWR